MRHCLHVGIKPGSDLAGVSPSTFTSGGGSNTASSGISSSQFGGNVQSQICTADPSLLNILNTA